MVNLNDNNIDLEDINKQTNTNLDLQVNNNIDNNIEQPVNTNDNVEQPIEPDFQLTPEQDINLDDLEDNSGNSLTSFQDIVDRFGFTKEEQLKVDEFNKLEKDKQTEKDLKKIDDLGGWVRLGDSYFNQDSWVGASVRESSYFKDTLNLNKKVDIDFLNNYDIEGAIKDAGLTNEESITELYESHLTNEEDFLTRLDHLTRIDEAQKRLKYSVDGDFLRTMFSYTFDPLIIAAELKGFAMLGNLSKVKNLSKIQTAGVAFAGSIPLYSGQELLINEMNNEKDTTEVIIGGLLGGVLNGVGGYFVKRSQILQRNKEVYQIKKEQYSINTENYNSVDNKIKEFDDEINKIYGNTDKNIKIDENVAKSFDRQNKSVFEKIDTFKEKAFKRLNKNKSYIKAQKEIEKVNKYIKENNC